MNRTTTCIDSNRLLDKIFDHFGLNVERFTLQKARQNI